MSKYCDISAILNQNNSLSDLIFEGDQGDKIDILSNNEWIDLTKYENDGFINLNDFEKKYMDFDLISY